MKINGDRIFHSAKSGRIFSLHKEKINRENIFADGYRLVLSEILPSGETIPLISKENKPMLFNRKHILTKNLQNGMVIDKRQTGYFTTQYSLCDVVTSGELQYKFACIDDKVDGKWFVGSILQKPLSEIEEYCEKFGVFGKKLFKDFKELLEKNA